jgi:hypothetical protein
MQGEIQVRQLLRTNSGNVRKVPGHGIDAGSGAALLEVFCELGSLKTVPTRHA